jgi:hypothetical protein
VDKRHKPFFYGYFDIFSHDINIAEIILYGNSEVRHRTCMNNYLPRFLFMRQGLASCRALSLSARSSLAHGDTSIMNEKTFKRRSSSFQHHAVSLSVQRVYDAPFTSHHGHVSAQVIQKDDPYVYD